MTSEARFAQRSQQIPQRFEPEKIQTLVGNLEANLLRFSGLAPYARLPRRIGWLIDRDIVFLLHALDQFLDEFVELAVRHHLLNLFAQVFVEALAVKQRLFDRTL